MSYNFTIGVLKDVSMAALDVVDPGPHDFDAVASFDNVEMAPGVAQLGSDVVVVDPLFGVNIEELANRLDTQAYLVAFGGVSDTYVIRAVGPIERTRVYSQGELTKDSGTPLPEEDALTDGDFEEDRHAAVLARWVPGGVNVLFDTDFALLAPSEI